MQSSSNGTLSALGLLACAAVAGMFAAKKWPQGPPCNLPLRAWDWALQQVAPPHLEAQNEARYEGPAPKFNPSSAAPGEAAPNCFAPPAVEFAEESPEAERSGEGPVSPGAVSTAATSAAPSPVRPASAVSRSNEPSQLNPSRYEPAKPSAFWPSDLADLLPLGGAADSSPASSRSRASDASAALVEASSSQRSIEQLVRRLEQMGAVVVRLERQRGTAGYLFRCELPLPQNPRYHRFFQAADAEPARAIQRVTRDVEAWKANERR